MFQSRHIPAPSCQRASGSRRRWGHAQLVSGWACRSPRWALYTDISHQLLVWGPPALGTPPFGFVSLFWLQLEACRIPVPRSGIIPSPHPAVEAWSPMPWTAKNSLEYLLLSYFIRIPKCLISLSNFFPPLAYFTLKLRLLIFFPP